MEALFVYGSLQPGGPNEHVLADLGGRWEAGAVRGHLRESGWGAELGYPGLVLDEGGAEVAGSVLFSPALAASWERLDAFEGSEYVRRQARVTLGGGGSVRANVYVLRNSV